MASFAPPAYASSSRSDFCPRTPTFPDPVYSPDELRSGMSLSSLPSLDTRSLPPYTLSRPPSYQPTCGSPACINSATRTRAPVCGSPTCQCAPYDLESQGADRKHWPYEKARKSKLRQAGEIVCCLVAIVGLVGIPLAVNRLTMHRDDA